MVEREWVQKRLYHVVWLDEKKCQGCGEEAATEHGGKLETTSRSNRGSGKCENVEGELEMTKRYHVASSGAKVTCQSESGNPRSKGAGTCQSNFRDHVATDGSFLGKCQASGSMWCSLMMMGVGANP